LIPHSCAARPAASAATCAANGVDLREPLKPAPPDDAHDSVLPCRSVIVMIVLLNDACTCAMPSDTFLRAFLRKRDAAAACAADCVLVAMSGVDSDVYVSRGAYFFSATPASRGPLRVRALVWV